MFAELRREQIAKIIQEKGLATVDELCKMFSVSSATIRNDLAELERQDLLQRTHGGAISCHGGVAHEQTSEEKEVQNIEQKRAICKEALHFIHSGNVIALDTGTTTYELAKYLLDFSNITVVTNDIQIASLLEQNKEIDILLLGGNIRHEFHCTIGGNVLDMLKDLYVDTFFLATNSVSVKRGFSTPRIEVGKIKTALVECASRTIALLDSSKVKREAFYSFAKIDQVQAIISDSNIDQDFVDEIDALGVKVICAQSEQKIKEG